MKTSELGRVLEDRLRKAYPRAKVEFIPDYVPWYSKETPSFPAIIISTDSDGFSYEKGNAIIQKEDEELYIDCENDGRYIIGLTPDESAPIGQTPKVGSERNPSTVFPPEIQAVQTIWDKLAHDYGDHGSCVIGEHLDFTYWEVRYRMECHSGWQGSLGAEHYLDYIKKLLEMIGATDFAFDYGMMD